MSLSLASFISLIRSLLRIKGVWRIEEVWCAMHISEPFGADKRLGTLSIAFTLTHTFSICHFSTLLCQELNMARCAEKNHFNLSSQAHLQAIGKVCYAPGYSLFYPHPWIAYLFADWNSRSWFCIHIYLYIALALYVCVWVCVLAPKRAKLWNGLMFLMTPPLCTKRLWSSHE